MTRGTLRIYLGAAPGVGKTFAMLNEGHRRAGRGTDVVVAAIDTHGRPVTAAQLDGLELVTSRVGDGSEGASADLELELVLARHPQLALVDELAHTNPPGSRHAKRWQDVEVLLDAGIDVVTTLDIGQLESVSDVVETITGAPPSETIPDNVVRRADQVELVDMTPEALRRRLAHGNVYPADRVDPAVANLFEVGSLAALRELALRWTADNADQAVQAYRGSRGIDEPWETQERVLVAVTGAPSGDHLIRRAARMARRAHADLVGVHVSDGQPSSTDGTSRLGEHRQLLVDLGGRYHEVVGADVAAALADLARSVGATQLVLGSTGRSRWTELVRGSVINRVIRLSGSIDVHVISTGDHDAPHRLPAVGPRRQSPLPRRRRWAGWAIAALGIPALTALLLLFHDPRSLSTVWLLNLLLVAVVAAVGGLRPAVVAAVVSSQTVNWFFTDPRESLAIDEAAHVVALVVYVSVAVLISVLVGKAARRAAEAQRARSEAEALASVAGRLSGGDDPVRAMLGQLRSTFEQESVALLRRADGGAWRADAVDGDPVPDRPTDGQHFPLGPDLELVLVPGHLATEDLRILDAFVAQLVAGVERRSLESAAAEVDARAQADELRTAILRAVSHDLRSPLSSIKASATSLLQDDIDWTPAQRREFATTIDEEADRLNRLVANLLDMSRIEAGAVRATNRGVSIDEVVASALGTVADPDHRVAVDIPPDLPEVRADAALLERVVANLTMNALEHTRPVAIGERGSPVRIEAGSVGDRALLRVIDRGRGLAQDQRPGAFEPFQRLDDSGAGGVGLGLAVVRGFVTAMGGSVVLDDTPGGGLTATVTLPVAGPDVPRPARADGPLVGAG